MGTARTQLSRFVECLLEIGQHPKEAEASEHSAYRQIFGLRAVHLMAFFIMIYVGCVFCQGFPLFELKARPPGWKLHSGAGSLHTSLKSEVADRPPAISPLASSGG